MDRDRFLRPIWRAFLGVSEMASAKMASAIGVRIDDVGSILKFRKSASFLERILLVFASPRGSRGRY